MRDRPLDWWNFQNTWLGSVGIKELLRETIGTWDKIMLFLKIIIYLFLFNGCKGEVIVFIKVQYKFHSGYPFSLGILILGKWKVLEWKSRDLFTNTKATRGLFANHTNLWEVYTKTQILIKLKRAMITMYVCVYSEIPPPNDVMMSNDEIIEMNQMIDHKKLY